MESSTTVSRKLTALLDIPLDSPSLTSGLDALAKGGSFGANTAEARRGLRGELERQSLVAARELLAAFAPVQEQLQAVQADVAAL